MTKTAFIAIVGLPNAGKSTVLNRLLGAKVAIVSDKPQTTRTRITGVLTRGETQLVFTDTPGFHKPRNLLGEKMAGAVSESIGGVDACLLVAEPFEQVPPALTELAAKLKEQNVPVILALNKTDTVPKKEKLLEMIHKLSRLCALEAAVPVSALKGSQMDELLAELEKLAVESVHYFPEDTLTDQPERVMAGEILREKLLRILDKEVPHGIAVEIERMRQRGDSGITDIDAVIYCEKTSHKGIIIGKNGETLKRAATRAREEMENFFQCRINLRCRVKVKEDWRNREGAIRSLGLG
ncbi:MAG TPA: GTPase Era [Clostridiales bacterium]|nr:MAG: GTPase Era [Firmicutes bacterium ADurb.Bin262]HOU09443.1 GTPase Era [Clostridiales bacterium]HQH62153.1 GTPase Era [Clostridiales bacterium]HQK73244.1 GTPase Era [Clostridiales bacterium]